MDSAKKKTARTRMRRYERSTSKEMFPLSMLETGTDFRLQDALRYGQMPLSVTSAGEAEKIEFLDAYVETYLREEIQQEALTRNLDSFYRFLTPLLHPAIQADRQPTKACLSAGVLRDDGSHGQRKNILKLLLNYNIL